MTSTLREAPPSTRDDIRDRIADAIASREGYPAALDIQYQLAEIALAAVAPLLAERDAELARLHASWMRLQEQLTYAREARDYALEQLMLKVREATPPPPTCNEWTPGDPEPGPQVQQVRGRQSGRIFDRDDTSPHGHTRWVHGETGWWSRWPYLVTSEGGVTLTLEGYVGGGETSHG